MAGTRGVFHVLVKNTDEFRTVVSFYVYVCVCTKLLQSCPTLCNPMDDSPSGPSVHEILQQEYWSGLPCPPPGDFPNPGIKPKSPALQEDSLLSEPPLKPLVELNAQNSRVQFEKAASAL